MSIHSMKRAATFTAALAFLCAATMADAQWWNRRSPYGPGKRAMDPAITDTPEYIDAAADAVRLALKARDFGKIERMHDELLALQRAGGNGKRVLIGLSQGLGDVKSMKPEEAAVFFADWRKALPTSKVRPAAEALSWDSRAWAARGNGFASSVSPEGWKLFHEYLQRASAVLAEGEAAGKQSPLWFNEALGLAGSLGEPSAVLDAIFDEGTGKFPLYLPLYQTRLNFLMPQWGGDYDHIDAFIRGAVRRTQSTEGTLFYMALYNQVLDGFHGDDFFQTTKASWKLMNHAFEDMMTQQPNASLMNRWATLACLAEDRDALRRLMEEIGPRVNLGQGLAGFPAEACLELAREAP